MWDNVVHICASFIISSSHPQSQIVAFPHNERSQINRSLYVMWYCSAHLEPRERWGMKKCWSCVRPFELVGEQVLLQRIETVLWYESFVYVVFGVQWIYIPCWGRNWMKFNVVIIDLESLKLSIIWWKTSNWGTLNEVSIACSRKYRVYGNSGLILVLFCFILDMIYCVLLEIRMQWSTSRLH